MPNGEIKVAMATKLLFNENVAGISPDFLGNISRNIFGEQRNGCVVFVDPRKIPVTRVKLACRLHLTIRRQIDRRAFDYSKADIKWVAYRANWKRARKRARGEEILRAYFAFDVLGREYFSTLNVARTNAHVNRKYFTLRWELRRGKSRGFNERLTRAQGDELRSCLCFEIKIVARDEALRILLRANAPRTCNVCMKCIYTSANCRKCIIGFFD